MYSLRQILVLASIFVVVVLVGSIRANEVHVIHPTGEFPADVVNVQTVVDDLGDRGVDGKIILEARNESGVPTAFNFGEGEYILGERGYVDVLSNNHIFGQD
ncbi:MAG: hypothetical protein ACYSTT_07070, partial [Planctomycetota bacterium]